MLSKNFNPNLRLIAKEYKNNRHTDLSLHPAVAVNLRKGTFIFRENWKGKIANQLLVAVSSVKVRWPFGLRSRFININITAFYICSV
jgi:hypothetical protein